jgi:hypothetical protein
MSFNAPRHDRIGKLRLQVPAGQMLQPPPELRALELHPSGLPQSAIVVMRRLRLARRGAHSQPGSAWREAAQGAVNAALRGAVRPIGGAVARPDDAVLFADMAELLACMARDWLDGTLASRWWWRELFTQTPALDAVCAAWLDNAPAIAAARALLRREGRWETFVARWPAADWARLLALPVSLTDTGADVMADAPRRGVGTSAASPSSLPAPANEAPAVAAGTAAATNAQTRSERGAAESRSVISSALATESIVSETGESTGAARDAANDDGSIAVAVKPGASDPATPPPAPMALRDAPPAVAPHAADRHNGVTAAPLPPSPQFSAPARAALREPEPPAESRIAFPRAAEPAWAIPDSPIAPQHQRPITPRVSPAFEAAALHTHYGGLFYLLNVALHLDLYADFTQPRRSGLALSPWDLLAWIGLRWFGASLQRDPLWAALAAWAGRAPDDEIGTAFTPPSPWQVPAAWLRPFERPEALTTRRIGDRILLRHPAGFCVCDLDAASAVQLPAELAGVPIVEQPPRPPPPACSNERHRWLAHLARYVRARCALALQANRRDVPAMVARHAAHVIATPATIEIRLCLATLPLPIRVAGLDRDPGWVPAAGRSLRFVFD